MRRRAVLGMAGGLVGCAGGAAPAGGGGVRLREVARLRHASIVQALAWHPDGSRLVVMSGAVEPVDLWDTAGWDKVATVRRRQGDPSSCAYLPDGRLLLPPLDIDDQWTTMGTLVDGHDGRVLGTVGAPDRGPKQTRLPDRMALSGDGRRLAVLFSDFSVAVFDVPAFTPVVALPGGDFIARGVALDATGSHLAVAGKYRRNAVDESDRVACLRLLNLSDGAQRDFSVAQPADLMQAAAFLGDVVATGGITGQLTAAEFYIKQEKLPIAPDPDRVWIFGAADGGLRRVHSWPSQTVVAMATSPDARLLAVLGELRLTLIATASQEVVATWPGMVGAYALAWHPNSRLLAYADDDVARVLELS